MLKKFHTSNSAENPIFSPYDHNSSGPEAGFDALLEPYGDAPDRLRKYSKMRDVSQKTSEIFIKCFFELFLKTG